MARSSASFPGKLSLGTGSVLPSPANDGSILGWVNNVAGHMVSIDGMKTWTAVKTATTGSPGGRDQARPLQSADGTWFQMMGAANKGAAAVASFRSTDPKTLSSWTFDGFLFTKNETNYGYPVDFYEVPDFYPLSNTDAGVTKHVLVVDPWGADHGSHVHNVEWHVGDWSPDGTAFTPTSTGLFDYGWWYAARSLSDGTNTGRRLMLGNIGSDVTHGA